MLAKALLHFTACQCPANSILAYSLQEQRQASYALTQEGATYLQAGSPEAQVFHAIPAQGLPQPQLMVQCMLDMKPALAMLLYHQQLQLYCCSKSLAMWAVWELGRP